MSISTTHQFKGSTIEEALSAAVSELGDDVEIVDAQKVIKRHRFGVRKKERFEVTASPRQPEADPDAQFESVLRAMVDKVDDEERVVDEDRRALPAPNGKALRSPRNGGVDLADSDSSWWSSAEFILPGEAGSPPEVEAGEQAVPAAIADAPTPEVDIRATVPELDLDGAAGRHARVVEPVSAPTGHGWSRDALLRMGLPTALVDRVTTHQLRTDLEWVGAMASAIDELLSSTGPTVSKCELTGYGHDAAVELILGACQGLRPGHLIVDGNRLEATATELALGVRASLRA